MPLNSLDHFVLCAGDKASVPAIKVLELVEGMIAGTNAQFRKQVDVPASGTADGNPGEWAVDATHVFFCTAPDVWVRIALTAW